MDFDEIDQILKRMREHGLAEFELERGGVRVRIRRAETAPGAHSGAQTRVEPPNADLTETRAGSPATDVTIVEAPVLGTFYRAGAPDAPPFTEVGDVVKPGDVLCIIEAMKLMNDIKSEYAGEIVDIFVENGQPVQYGERLFAIRRG